MITQLLHSPTQLEEKNRMISSRREKVAQELKSFHSIPDSRLVKLLDLSLRSTKKEFSDAEESKSNASTVMAYTREKKRQPSAIKVSTKEKNHTHLATGQRNGDDVALGRLNLAHEVALLLVGDPACLFTIVRLGLVDSLLFERYEQIRGRIELLVRLLRGARHLDTSLSAVPSNKSSGPFHSEWSILSSLKTISSVLGRELASSGCGGNEYKKKVVGSCSPRRGRRVLWLVPLWLPLSCPGSLYGFGGGRTASGGTNWAALRGRRKFIMSLGQAKWRRPHPNFTSPCPLPLPPLPPVNLDFGLPLSPLPAPGSALHPPPRYFHDTTVSRFFYFRSSASSAPSPPPPAVLF